jgi:hypothetical protein
LLVRFTSPLPVFGITLRSWLWEAYRLARQRSRLAVGIAVVALAAVIGVTVGVFAGSAPPAHAAGNPRANAAAAAPPDHPQHGASQHWVAQNGARQSAPGRHGTGQKAGGQQASAQHGASQHGASQNSGSQHGAAQHGAAQHSGSQHGAAQHGAAKPTGGQHAAAAQHPAQAPAPQPYSIYDSVTPSAIPASQYSIASYADGHYAATASQVAGRGSVLWIDVTGSNPSAAVLDVEPGDASPAVAASWAWHKLHSDPSAVARIYTMRSEWPSVQAAMSQLPSQMQSHVHYWIADPTGVNHLVPGSDATQWYWGSHYDITTANPGF